MIPRLVEVPLITAVSTLIGVAVTTVWWQTILVAVAVSVGIATLQEMTGLTFIWNDHEEGT